MNFREWMLAGWYPDRPPNALWSILSVVLSPLSHLTHFISKKRQQQQRALSEQWKSQSAAQGLPKIVVIGNLVAGGAGKTPLVIALSQALPGKIGIIARGDALDDEARLLRMRTGLPVVTHPNRRIALDTLIEQHPDLDWVVSDDGLQHAALPRNLELLVIDSRGLGNGALLPTGPLRESAQRLGQVNAILLTHTSDQAPFDLAHSPYEEYLSPMVPTWACATRAIGLRQLSAPNAIIPVADFLARCPAQVAALAGIASPNKFFNQLQTILAEASIELANNACLALPDHAVIDPVQVSQWINQHRAQVLIVTEKDWVKFSPKWSQADSVWALVIESQLPVELVPWLTEQTR